jgi:SET domain-containing protein
MGMKTSWVNPKLEVRRSKIHGKGVFSRDKIRKGERVAIFGGEIMRIDEIDNLPAKLQEYPMQIEERFVLGSRASRDPEDADFFNHSCEPNTGFKGQIFLVALRNIEPDEEITFDYAMVVSKSVQSNAVFEMACDCGAKGCRRKITENDWKRPALQKRYDRYFSEYIQEKIDKKKGRHR